MQARIKEAGDTKNQVIQNLKTSLSKKRAISTQDHHTSSDDERPQPDDGVCFSVQLAKFYFMWCKVLYNYANINSCVQAIKDTRNKVWELIFFLLYKHFYPGNARTAARNVVLPVASSPDHHHSSDDTTNTGSPQHPDMVSYTSAYHSCLLCSLSAMFYVMFYCHSQLCVLFIFQNFREMTGMKRYVYPQLREWQVLLYWYFWW